MADFPLAPVYDHRFSLEDVDRAYHRLEAAFDAGDYCLVAERAPPGSALFGAAMVMTGFPHVGLPILERAGELRRQEAACRALALWSLDRDAEALAVLDGILATAPSDDPLRLPRRLMARGGARIAQIASVTLMHANLGASATARTHACGGFLIERLGIAAGDQGPDGYRFDQRFDQWLDARPPEERPDFILAATPQSFLPNGLNNVDIPKIAYQHDIDVFIDRNWDNYRQFDLSLVCTSFEHFELSRATGVRSAALFQNDPIGQPFVIGDPALSKATKSIDVLLSGSVLDYSHPEKARFAFLLSRLADERVIRVIEGYLPASRYAEMLAEAKFLPVVSRLRGNPSPRWRDALCNGAFCLHPRNTLFGRLSRGLFAYDERDIAGDVRRHLERYDASVPGDPYCAAAAWNDVETMYRFFATPREKRLETAFKAMAFAHALIDARPRPRPPSPRVPWLMPFWEAGVFDPMMAAAQAARMARWRETEGLRDETDYAHLGALYASLAIIVEWRFLERPHVEIGDLAGPPDRVFQQLIDRAEAVLIAGVARFPDSLLLRFNALHLRLMFALPLYNKPAGAPSWRLVGDDQARGHQTSGDDDAARRLRPALEQLIEDEPKLRFDPRQGGLGFAPAIHMDRLIPYMRLSGDLLRKAASSPGTDACEAPRGILRAALFGYRGRLAALEERPAPCSERAFSERAFSEQAALEWAALEWYERGLAHDPANSGLLEHAVETGVSLFERGELPEAALPTLVGRAARLFEHYPVLLFRWPGRVVEMLIRLDRRAEARAFLADWFRFGRAIESADGVPPSINAAKYRAVIAYDALLPEAERRRLAEWRSIWAAGRDAPTPSNQFERFVLAALLMERLGVETALAATRRAACALAAGQAQAEETARAERRRLVDLINQPDPALAFAMIAMTQPAWDPEWSSRRRQPRPAAGWPPTAAAALRDLPLDAEALATLQRADARLAERSGPAAGGVSNDKMANDKMANDKMAETGRWVFVNQLHKWGWDSKRLGLSTAESVQPNLLPSNLKLFTLDWLSPRP